MSVPFFAMSVTEKKTPRNGVLNRGRESRVPLAGEKADEHKKWNGGWTGSTSPCYKPLACHQRGTLRSVDTHHRPVTGRRRRQSRAAAQCASTGAHVRLRTRRTAPRICPWVQGSRNHRGDTSANRTRGGVGHPVPPWPLSDGVRPSIGSQFQGHYSSFLR